MRAICSIAGAILAASGISAAAENTAPERCPNAVSTLDLNECMAGIVQGAEDRRAAYLAAAVARNAAKPDVADKIKASDAAFTEYAQAECGAVYEFWIEGSIRNVMAMHCHLALTDQRTHTIWRDWLTYMDSSAPDLPEPLPTP